jgi:hypothetical protein
MSSGNVTTEFTRLELEADERVVREAALVRNGVLRRALEIAARDYARLAGHPDAWIVLMLTWVMQASEEMQAGKER